MEQFCGCWMTYPRCKEDCYWYREWQDMGAHIPYCRCKNTDFIKPQDCENCEQYHSKYKPTNADKIRKMSDEKLAEWLTMIERRVIEKAMSKLHYYTDEELKADWLDWLKQGVEE